MSYFEEHLNDTREAARDQGAKRLEASHVRLNKSVVSIEAEIKRLNEKLAEVNDLNTRLFSFATDDDDHLLDTDSITTFEKEVNELVGSPF